jgi:hypothetical protein
MNLITLTLCLMVLAAQGAKVGKVESDFDKAADFRSFRTYSWQPGYDAHDPTVHKMIVSAIERELAQLGFTKRDTNADVTIAYYTVLSTEIDLKALDRLEREGRSGMPTKSLGRLLIIMRKPGADQRLWSVSTREHVDPDPAKAEETIAATTSKLFAEYPGRRDRHH